MVQSIIHYLIHGATTLMGYCPSFCFLNKNIFVSTNTNLKCLYLCENQDKSIGQVHYVRQIAQKLNQGLTICLPVLVCHKKTSGIVFYHCDQMKQTFQLSSIYKPKTQDGGPFHHQTMQNNCPRKNSSFSVTFDNAIAPESK